MIRTWLVTVGDRPGNIVVEEIEPVAGRAVPVVVGQNSYAEANVKSSEIASTAGALLRAALPPDWGGGA